MTGSGFRMGEIVELTGKTLKGKNRVREHGSLWFVREVDRSVLGRNLGLLVCPVTQLDRLSPPNPDFPGAGWTQSDGVCRWLHPTRDADFTVAHAESASTTGASGALRDPAPGLGAGSVIDSQPSAKEPPNPPFFGGGILGPPIGPQSPAPSTEGVSEPGRKTEDRTFRADGISRRRPGSLTSPAPAEPPERPT